MSTKFLSSVVPVGSGTSLTGNSLSYLLGGIIAFLILVYLIYTLFRPEKF